MPGAEHKGIGSVSAWSISRVQWIPCLNWGGEGGPVSLEFWLGVLVDDDDDGRWVIETNSERGHTLYLLQDVIAGCYVRQESALLIIS